MITIRLLDAEGRTIRTDFPILGPPPLFFVLPADRSLKDMLLADIEPTADASNAEIRYDRERPDGAGVWIYRRSSPLWAGR